MIILGLMSGTSLDGLDLALCNINSHGYSLLAADTVPYPDCWRSRLASLENASALEYVRADVELGHYIGHVVNDILSSRNMKAEVIASHGHTIFHQPIANGQRPTANSQGLTSQIGNGDAIAAETGLPVVCNFRTLDVALGGQGAPLVPIGDQILFGQYDACLNLGGIANVSYQSASGQRIAFDICPCNMALNPLAARLGLDYDPQGEYARLGHCNNDLLNRLDQLEFYRQAPPKSLGKEWYVEHFRPIIEASSLDTRDLLATVTRHIASQIASALIGRQPRTLLVTGGGAFNSYLIETLSMLLPSVQVTVPEPLVINYKEAIIFALLGYLRLTGQVNTLCSVTGARCDSIGGNLCGLFSPTANSQ